MRFVSIPREKNKATEAEISNKTLTKKAAWKPNLVIKTPPKKGLITPNDTGIELRRPNFLPLFLESDELKK